MRIAALPRAGRRRRRRRRRSPPGPGAARRRGPSMRPGGRAPRPRAPACDDGGGRGAVSSHSGRRFQTCSGLARGRGVGLAERRQHEWRPAPAGLAHARGEPGGVAVQRAVSRPAASRRSSAAARSGSSADLGLQAAGRRVEVQRQRSPRGVGAAGRAGSTKANSSSRSRHGTGRRPSRRNVAGRVHQQRRPQPRRSAAAWPRRRAVEQLAVRRQHRGAAVRRRPGPAHRAARCGATLHGRTISANRRLTELHHATWVGRCPQHPRSVDPDHPRPHTPGAAQGLAVRGSRKGRATRLAASRQATRRCSRPATAPPACRISARSARSRAPPGCATPSPS